MKSYKPLLFLAGLVVLGILIASPAHAQTPSLVADQGRTVSTVRIADAQTFHIDSTILKETRRIIVLLPASYSKSAPDRKYPVTVVTDGESLVSPVAIVSEDLVRNGQIPESVIVGIENTGRTDRLDADQKRVYDLTPPGLSVSGSSLNEGGDLFLDFIEKELLPALDHQFKTAAPHMFIGHSSGGILATYIAATRPGFCAAISLDAPINLSENWLAKKLIERAKGNGRPVRYASLEAAFGWPENEWKTMTATAPASWRIYREKLQLEGHETMQMLGAYIGLRQVFGDYSRLSAPSLPTTSVLPYYAKVSESIGAPVLPPQRVLQNVIDDLLMEGRGKEAREAYSMLVSGFGTSGSSAALAAKIAEAERRPAPTETVEGLLATKFPTPEEARPYIGEWVGDIAMRADAPRTGRTTLRIRVVDGRVVGETINHLDSGQEMTRPWEYLKITPQGFTWGSLNHNRPHGVMLFEGKIEGDSLYGKSRWGGIDFRMEDGSTPPPLIFSFKRLQK